MSSDRRVLFLDAYDSFSNNIIALLESVCGVEVMRIYIDAFIPNFEDFLSTFSAVVCGPGPGHPGCLRDVGLFKKMWKLPDDRLLPVLGICLGFQSLAYECGASVVPLPRPRHGLKTLVTSASASIFDGLTNISTVQYHSLHAKLRPAAQPPTLHDLWTPSKQCPLLQPLAWDFSSSDGATLGFATNPSSILMAVKHTTKPFYGIQFHPESICSEPSARRVVANWWREALACSSKLDSDELTMSEITESPKLKIEYRSTCTTPRTRSDSTSSDASGVSSSVTSVSTQEKQSPKILSVTISLGNLTVPSICEALNLPANELIILDSEMRQLPQIGEASIIGIIASDTKKIQYSVGGAEVSINSGTASEPVDLRNHGGSIFSFLKAYIASFAIRGDDDRAFCGGLIGYISYEACLETIGIHSLTPNGCPDLCFAFVKQSLLVDHRRQLLYVQGLLEGEHDRHISDWVHDTSSLLKRLSAKDFTPTAIPSLSLAPRISQKVLPGKSDYKSKISQCQELINAGESYELCLTDQTSITIKGDTTAWSMYKRLRSLNPANFGAFVRLGPLTILSTSPERFMKWSRFQESSPTDGDDSRSDEQFATCQFRPMKGTVCKRQEMPDGSVHHLPREEATAMLATSKEQAENLMILDLIRHDLHGVCRDVSVPGLMVVEDYESVFQLVSVIEGKISKPLHFGPWEGPSGIDCLAASLPPGSMTGAPKKRSCQLLQEIEKKPRSIYSGVLGYIDVRGNADFSVLIRSMYKWDDECDSGKAKWNIGAGGAITTLSTEEGEWEEMLTKLQSTFQLFESQS